MSKKPQNLGQINQTNISYYFDSLRRDVQDQSKIDRRYSDCLAIRDSLLHLPEEVYQTTISSIRALLGYVSGEKEAVKVGGGKNSTSKSQRLAAQDLYNQSRNQR